jgi:hypothetical protein
MTKEEQKKDIEIYKQLLEYENIADSMRLEVDNNFEISLKEKRNILYPLIDEIKEIAIKIVDNYIIYLKNKNNKNILAILTDDISLILKKIDYFKNKIYDLYKLGNKK